MLILVYFGDSYLDLANVEAIPFLENIAATLVEVEGSFFSLDSPKDLNFQFLFQEATDKSLRLEKKLPNSNHKELPLTVLF